MAESEGAGEIRARLASGETVLFLDARGREWLRELRPGRRFSLANGAFDVDDVIGKPEGSIIRTHSGGELLVLRPSYGRLIPNLPRRAQVIYPKDAGAILVYADIRPGLRVVEAGVGPGALTLALLRMLGATGSLISIDRREDHVAMARETVRQFHGDAPGWQTIVAEAADALPGLDADRVLLDVPDPGAVIPAAARALRPGGILTCWVPTTLQLYAIQAAFAESGCFGAAQTFELMQRFWHVTARSVRPDHRMVAHTGFLTLAWRLAAERKGAWPPPDRRELARRADAPEADAPPSPSGDVPRDAP